MGGGDAVKMNALRAGDVLVLEGTPFVCRTRRDDKNQNTGESPEHIVVYTTCCFSPLDFTDRAFAGRLRFAEDFHWRPGVNYVHKQELTTRESQGQKAWGSTSGFHYPNVSWLGVVELWGHPHLVYVEDKDLDGSPDGITLYDIGDGMAHPRRYVSYSMMLSGDRQGWWGVSTSEDHVWSGSTATYPPERFQDVIASVTPGFQVAMRAVGLTTPDITPSVVP